VELKNKLLEAFSEFLEKAVGGTQREVELTNEVEVVKSLDEEERMALFVVLEPQGESYTSDLHGDTYTAKEIEKACNDFSRHCNKANLFHKIETENAQVVQNFITPVDFVLEDARIIKAGTWLQWWYFPETQRGEEIWKMVKTGEINGVSVGCRAVVENLDD
jgi:hypothetical protein